MTDLQLGLAVIGALAVAGVLVYNRLQERSVRKHAEGAFGSTHSDVLMRREPTLGPAPRRPQVKDPALPDARVDYVIELSLPAPAPCAIVLEAWSPVEQRFARRVLLAANDGGGWRRLAHADPGTCQALRTGLQLVSRSGVVSDAELIEFRSQVETLAARMGAAVAAPEMRAALEAAHDLDRTCAEVDIQVALHVVGVPPQAGRSGEAAPFRPPSG